MRKSLHQGTKTDVLKRRAKELGLPVIEVKSEEDLSLYPSATINRSVIIINPQYKRIVTFNHPCLFQ